MGSARETTRPPRGSTAAYVPVTRRSATSFVPAQGEGADFPPSGVRWTVRSAEAISTQKLAAQRAPAQVSAYAKAEGVDSRLLAAAHLVTWTEREAIDAVDAFGGPCDLGAVATRLGARPEVALATLERLVRRGLVALR